MHQQKVESHGCRDRKMRVYGVEATLRDATPRFNRGHIVQNPHDRF